MGDEPHAKQELPDERHGGGCGGGTIGDDASEAVAKIAPAGQTDQGGHEPGVEIGPMGQVGGCGGWVAEVRGCLHVAVVPVPCSLSEVLPAGTRVLPPVVTNLFLHGEVPHDPSPRLLTIIS